MRLEHQFRVAAPIDEVWSALLDPQHVAPCMPGATLTSVDGESFAGTVKVKLGPVALLYKGSGAFESTDADARRVVIKASGKDSRGNGTASATVEVTLSADSSSTVAAVVTDLSVTGRPAQFGRGMITEVGGKILDRFAECLAARLAPADAPPEPAAAATPAATGSVATDPTSATEPATATDPAAATESATTTDPATAAAPAGAERPATAAPDQPVTTESAGAERPAADARRPPRPAVGSTARPAESPPPPTSFPPEAEPLDLLEVAGAPAAKRAAVLIGAALLLIVIVAWLRRR
ncbi:MAG TPA: SRPBCC family protein [Kutzneria sp.]|nr:SRPBCC family protein [Kutzneria sp.]